MQGQQVYCSMSILQYGVGGNQYRSLPEVRGSNYSAFLLRSACTMCRLQPDVRVSQNGELVDGEAEGCEYRWGVGDGGKGREVGRR